MKTQLLLIALISSLMIGCNKDPSQALLPKKDTTQVITLRQYKYKIGEGVEIYKAKLVWVYDQNRVYSVATIDDTIPAVRYDDLLTYEREPKTRNLLFTFTQPVQTLLTMKPSPPVVAKEGYTVMVNRVPVFNTLIITGGTGLDDKGVHLWLPENWNRTEGTSLSASSIVVEWDSVLRSTNPPTPRNLPDPRYDKRLIDRLKSDGKLIGF